MEQADPSVLVKALERIKDYPVERHEMQRLAEKALTTYKESKPSPSITREQADKVWDAASESAYKCKRVSGSSEWDKEGHKADKEEYLKQFDKQ